MHAQWEVDGPVLPGVKTTNLSIFPCGYADEGRDERVAFLDRPRETRPKSFFSRHKLGFKKNHIRSTSYNILESPNVARETTQP